MTRAEQIDRIVSSTGYSEAIIRNVWQATRKCMIDALKRGETFDLCGFCSFKPVERHKLCENGELKYYTSVQIGTSRTIKNELESELKNDTKENVYLEDTEVDIQVVDNDVLAYDISALK